jgi:myo-inositol 2-dehydrogenase/D-chiro-inositol 1-dehydrogenase
MESALIGYGKWGQKFYDTLKSFDNVKYILTRNEINLKNSTTNIELIIEDPQIKNVFITTPINTHFELTRKFLLTKKNVFCEKVLCISNDEHLELEELARRNHVKLFVGYIYLYNDAYDSLKRLISHKKIKKLEIVWSKYGTFNENINLNLTSHILSVLIDMFGECLNVEMLCLGKEIPERDYIAFKANFLKLSDVSITINRLSDQKKLIYTFHTDEEIISWDSYSLENYYSTPSPLENEIKNFLSEEKSDHNLLISRLVTSTLNKYFLIRD